MRREPVHRHSEAQALSFNLIDHGWKLLEQKPNGNTEWLWDQTRERIEIQDNVTTPGHYQAVAITARLIQLGLGKIA